jgi:hypothetical protein
MRLREFLFACAACALASVCAHAQTLERAFIEGRRVEYGGYTIERVVDDGAGESRAVVTRAGRELVRLADGAPRPDSTRLALFPLLGRGAGRQLVVEQDTGGAHCCTIYRVYDLGAEPRALFDGADYGIDEIGDDMSVADIDGDGRYELAQDVMAFDYFQTSHAGSVFPVVVFAYDERAGRYLPANRRFSAYVLRGIARDVRRAEATGRRLTPDERASEFHGEHFTAVMQALLKYVYAGEEAKGWAFFDAHYRQADKAALKEAVRQKLLESAVYRATYGLAPLKKDDTDAR